MSKHTPGPWYAVGGMVEIGNDELPDVCTCDPQLFGQGHLPTTPEREYANARLIAAAPDLLEALKGMLSRTDGQAIYNFMEPQREAARAAIAKATGENE